MKVMEYDIAIGHIQQIFLIYLMNLVLVEQILYQKNTLAKCQVLIKA